MKKFYSLPDGTQTASAKRCQKEWEDLARPICKLTGAELSAFDPSVQLTWNGLVFTLPVGFLQEFNATLVEDAKLIYE